MEWKNYLGKGSVFLIGGNAHLCLTQLVALLGGPEKANILVLAHASRESQAGPDVAAALQLRGVPDGQLSVQGYARHDNGAAPIQIPKGCNAIFFCGGDQKRIMTLLSDEDKRAIKTFLVNGGMLAGTSAGVPVFGSVMIGGGTPAVKDRANDYCEGLGIIPAVLFEQHFTERGRYPRLLTAIIQLAVNGFGIDEDTALHISAEGIGTVFGKGAVYLLRASTHVRSDLKRTIGQQAQNGYCAELPLAESDPSYSRSVIGTTVDCLGAGASVSLSTWEVELPDS